VDRARGARAGGDYLTRGLSAALLLAACATLTGDFSDVIAIEYTGPPSPRLEEGDTVRLTAVALGLYWVVAHTRLGMWLRAGASNRRMIGALGVNIERLFTLVFGLGTALAALAGLMAAPIRTVQIGMSNDILSVSHLLHGLLTRL